ncbi:uncharacterized protein [Spinacia oleracea]|uniref:Uncharacterized protein isoform X2 n=1 Tax=Spinacia oleracea TaxID=3562 RepID=A0ABM3RDF9_SPIOL|nr:uncharacterized protein LOC110784908 isoform X2 [Spinacia oleracea]
MMVVYCNDLAANRNHQELHMAVRAAPQVAVSSATAGGAGVAVAEAPKEEKKVEEKEESDDVRTTLSSFKLCLYSKLVMHCSKLVFLCSKLLCAQNYLVEAGK